MALVVGGLDFSGAVRKETDIINTANWVKQRRPNRGRAIWAEILIMYHSYQPWEEQSNSTPVRKQHVQRPSLSEKQTEATQCECPGAGRGRAVESRVWEAGLSQARRLWRG